LTDEIPDCYLVGSMITSPRSTEVQSWPIDKLVFYVRNPRKNDAAVDRMCSSIREFGFKIPVLARSDGEVVDGHLRTWADFDEDLLALELQELTEADFDLSLTGFDPREIDDLLMNETAHPEREEVIPEAPAVPVSQAGDLWLCGPHRVLCGDATSTDAVQRVLSGAKPFLMQTDPPYGVSYDPGWRVEHDGGGRHALGKVANDDQVDWTPALRLFGGDVAYVWHAGVHAAIVAQSLQSIDFQIRAQIIWCKQHFVFGRGNYHWQHEPCWYAVRHGCKSRWNGDRTQSTIWSVQNANPHGGSGQEDQTGHGTQKPVELMRRPILNHTARGQGVYDPFQGSGTSMIAAEQTERVCYGLEIEPAYVDVIVLRWQVYSKRQAVLDGDGRTFEKIAAERQTGAV
jgi:DNA modification methylase